MRIHEMLRRVAVVAALGALRAAGDDARLAAAEHRAKHHFTHIWYADREQAPSELCSSANLLRLPPSCERALAFEVDGTARHVRRRSGDGDAALSAAVADAVAGPPADAAAEASRPLLDAVAGAEAAVATLAPPVLADAAAVERALDEDGYAVVDALDAKALAEATELFDQLVAGEVEVAGDGETPACALRRAADPVTGLLTNAARVAHGPLMWHLRRRVASRFQRLWNDDDVVTSFDVPSALLSATRDDPWPMQTGLHVDANWHRGASQRGRRAVQGMILLTAQDRRSGGLVVVPGSHRDHESIARRYGDTSKAAGAWLMPVPRDAPELDGKPRALLEVEAGRMVLWDSRLAHAVVPPLDPRPLDGGCGATLRAAAYVCMTPRKWASDAWVDTRWLAFHQQLATGHWPHFDSVLRPVAPWDVARFDPLVHWPTHVDPAVCRMIGRLAPPPDDPLRQVSLCVDGTFWLGVPPAAEGAEARGALLESRGHWAETRAALLESHEAALAKDPNDPTSRALVGAARWAAANCNYELCDRAAASRAAAELRDGLDADAAALATFMGNTCNGVLPFNGRPPAAPRSTLDHLLSFCAKAADVGVVDRAGRCPDDPAPLVPEADDDEDARWVTSGAPGDVDAVDGFGAASAAPAPPLSADEAATLDAARAGVYRSPDAAASRGVAVAVCFSGETRALERTAPWLASRFLPALRRAAGDVELLARVADDGDAWKVARHLGAIPGAPLASFALQPPEESDALKGLRRWVADYWRAALRRRHDAQAGDGSWYGGLLADGLAMTDDAPDVQVPAAVSVNRLTMWAGLASLWDDLEARRQSQNVTYAFVVRMRTDVVVDAGRLERGVPWGALRAGRYGRGAVYLPVVGCGCNVRGPPDTFGVAAGDRAIRTFLRGPFDEAADLWVAWLAAQKARASRNYTVEWDQYHDGVLAGERRVAVPALAGRADRARLAAADCAAAGYEGATRAACAAALLARLATDAFSHAWRTLRPRQVLDPYWGTAWYAGLVGGAGEEARAMNPFAFESEQVLGIVLRRAGLAVRVVPDLRYTVVRAASSKAFHAAPFRGRFFGAKCMLGTTAPPWPPDGLDTVAASYFASWETSDRLYRWPDGFDHVEPFAGAPPPPPATVVTARHRLANGTRVSLYAAGFVARSQA